MPLPDPLEPFLAHEEFLRRLLRGLLPDEGRVDDVLQQTWLAALKHPPRNARGVRCWLRTVARNFALRTRREEQRRSQRELTAARPSNLPPAVDEVLQTALYKQVDQAVAELREPYRQVVFLRYYEGLKPGAIARRLGIPPGTVHSRLRRGLDLLRKHLERRGETGPLTWRGFLAGLSGTLRRGLSGPASLGRRFQALFFSTSGLFLTLAGLFLVVLLTVVVWRGTPPGSLPALSTGLRDGRTLAAGPAPREGRLSTQRISAGPLGEQVPAGDEHRFVGRVVDRRRQASPGASVSLYRRGFKALEARTGPRGCFRLRLRHQPRRGPLEIGILVLDERGQAAIHGSHWFQGGLHDLGTLVLAPAEKVSVRAVESGSQPVLAARVTVRMLNYRPWELSRPTHVYLGRFLTNDQGLVRLPPLPHGQLLLRAAGPSGHQGRLEHLLLRPLVKPLKLILHPARDLLVTVLEEHSERPLPGVALQLDALRVRGSFMTVPDDVEDRIPLTNVRGQTRIRGLSGEENLVISSLSNQFLPAGAKLATVRVEPGQREAVLHLPRRRQVSWPVEAGQMQVPAEGSRVQVYQFLKQGMFRRPFPGRLVQGRLVVPRVLLGSRNALAFASSGGVALLPVPAPGEAPKAVSFQPGRALTVRVWDAGGEGLAGLHLRTKQHQGRVAWVREATTDGAGRLLLEGLPPWRCNIFLVQRTDFDAKGLETWLGEVDLAAGADHLDFTLAPKRRVALGFLLNKQRRLPPFYFLLSPRALLGPLDEQPATGQVFFDMRSFRRKAAFVPLILASERSRATLVKVPLSKGQDPIRLQVDRSREPPLDVHLLPPPDGWYKLIRLAFRPPTGRWITQSAGTALRVGPERYRFSLLPTGRQRLMDEKSGAMSPVFTLDGKHPLDREVVLDLSQVGWAQGQVVVPQGEDPALAIIRADLGEGLHGSWARVKPDGSFSVRVPGNRVVLLEVRHPKLVLPAGTQGPLVMRPVAGLSLTLVQSPRAIVPLLLPAGSPPLHGAQIKQNRVLVFAGSNLEGPARASRRLSFKTRDPELYRLPVGRFTLWVDVPGFAPATILDADLQAGVTRLHPVRLERGARVRVVVIAKNGDTPPPLTVTVAATVPPLYERKAASLGGDQELTVGGLGAGTFKVSINPRISSRGTDLVTKTLVLDGRSQETIRFDWP